MVDRKGFGLEIGPRHNPVAPKGTGSNVHILDHASADELREKYKDHDVRYYDKGCFLKPERLCLSPRFK